MYTHIFTYMHMYACSHEYKHVTSPLWDLFIGVVIRHTHKHIHSIHICIPTYLCMWICVYTCVWILYMSIWTKTYTLYTKTYTVFTHIYSHTFTQAHTQYSHMYTHIFTYMHMYACTSEYKHVTGPLWDLLIGVVIHHTHTHIHSIHICMWVGYS